MGSGKSSVGRVLSRVSGYDFLDMDKYIEEKNNMSISEMFKINEAYFRDKELDAAKGIGRLDKTVVATGGGAVKNPIIMDELSKNGIIVYIKRDISTILQTSNTSIRPIIADDPQKLYGIFDERKPLYEKYGQVVVENNSTVNKCADEILKKIYDRGIVL